MATAIGECSVPNQCPWYRLWFGIVMVPDYHVNRAADYEPRDAIPGYQAPVVRRTADGERELVVLNWGFMLLQKDKAPKRVTNIRDDAGSVSAFTVLTF
jgi:putative SOS response-associated peptidase YedK